MPNWTSEQLDAITDRGHSLIVCAAAGSGKTAVLVERIVQLICEGCPVDRMLVVTFTNAAASEMRQRIGDALGKAAAQNPALAEQVMALPRASISTLHRFCGNLLREHFHALGIDPAFRIADEQECGVLAQQAMEDALYACYETADPEFMATEACYPQEEMTEIAGRIYAYMMTRPDPWAWLDRAVASLGLPADALHDSPAVQMLLLSAKEELTRLREEALKTLALCRGEGGPMHYEAAAAEDVSLADGLLDAALRGYTSLAHELAHVSFATLGRKKKTDVFSEDIAEEVKARREALQAYAKTIGLELVFGGEYGLRPFVKAVAEDIDHRCVACYRMRFEATAQYSAQNVYKHLTSTLFISPYQNHELMLQAAQEAAQKHGVAFLHRDFRPYFREGQERARQLEIYMQKYCGCVFSEEERFKKHKRPKDMLTPHEIARELDTRWAGRGEIGYAEEMPSTNLRAKEMARAGAPHGSLAVCENQTAGRGRLDRSWDTPAGQALTQSLLLRPRLAPEQVHLVTLAAAVAAAQAIRDVCPKLKPGIKWPNDVILNGKKCAGILCEMGFAPDGSPYVVPGVGINVNQLSFAGELADKATSLLMEMRAIQPKMQPIHRRHLLCAYLKRMEEAVDALERDGLLGILGEYVGRSVTLGSRVRVIGPEYDFCGTAKAIDETGALIVTDEEGTDRRVLCGDVSVRGMMGYV